MDPKLKTELLKIALAMRKARQYERQQEEVKKNERPVRHEPDALAIAARKFVEEERKREALSSGEKP